jgi:serine phosphatase RsbU (regulator of sigma subunit)/CRP-like cAMP-binding protein
MTTHIDRLRLNILFETLNDETFSELKKKLSERRYSSGEIILEDNADGEDLYLLVEGRVKIVKQTKTGDEKLLALLHSGDFFGELELIDGRPRSARVVALDDCIVATMNKLDFNNLLFRNHPFALRVMQVLSLRLRATNNHFISELEKYAFFSRMELHKLEQLIEATKNVNSTLELEKLLKVILDTALHIVDGDRGTLYLVDEEKGELWSKVYIGSEHFTIKLPMGKGIAGHVAATGDTINLSDAYLDPRFNPKVDKKTGYRTKTVLCMPLKNKDDKIVGVLQLLNKHKGLFTRDDENFIRALSIHAAIAIENARLYEEEKAYRQIREEVRLAAKIQLDLLPKTFPEINGYDIAGKTIPAQEVGGDYFDFIPLQDDQLAICLGDVSGKGLPASLLMANLQATLRGQSFGKCSPKDCLSRSNSLLYRSTSPDKFVTIFYCHLDTKKHQLTYSNAGHDNPFLLTHTKKIRRLKKGGIVLGVLDKYPYEEESIKLQRGEILVIYTDGIAEAMNSKGDMFGEDRISALLKGNQNTASEKIIDVIFEAVKKFAGSAPQSDDITMVVVKRL